MTIVALAKLQVGDQIYVSAGADSEVSDDGYRIVGIENASKLFKIKDAVIAISGGLAIAEVLQDLQMNTKRLKKLDLSDMKGVRNLAGLIYQDLKEITDKSVVSSTFDQAEALLIATPNNIYKVFQDLTCYSFNNFTASGAGEYIFNGAMEALLRNIGKDPTHETLDAKLREAIEITSRFALHCGGEIQIKHPGMDISFRTRK